MESGKRELVEEEEDEEEYSGLNSFDIEPANELWNLLTERTGQGKFPILQRYHSDIKSLISDIITIS